MSKETGMAWTTCTVDDSGGSGRAIKNDVTNLDLSMTNGVQDTTGLDKSAIERQLLLGDFSLTLNGAHHQQPEPQQRVRIPDCL